MERSHFSIQTTHTFYTLRIIIDQWEIGISKLEKYYSILFIRYPRVRICQKIKKTYDCIWNI